MPTYPRSTGKRAVLYLGAILCTELQNIKLNVKPDVVESKGMGYYTPQRTLDGYDATVTASRKQRPGVLHQFMAACAALINTNASQGFRVMVYSGAVGSDLLYDGYMIPSDINSDLPDGEHMGEDITLVASAEANYLANTALVTMS